jgi:transglutaminase-like putative cysteine protease
MMRKLFIAVALCLSMAGYAQNNSITALLEKAGDAGDYKHAPYVTIFDSTSVEMQESGLSYFHMHSLYKILTPAGAKEKAIIKYGYDPLTAFVELREATIYRKNGEIESLDVSKVLDYAAPARMIYWGAREIMLEVGRLEPGDAVELKMFKKGFTYALLQQELPAEDERYIPPMRGHFYDIIPFYSSTPLLEKNYTVSVPKDKVLQYEFYNGEAKSSVVLRGDRYIYSFTKSDIMPVSRESNMVAFDNVLPKLLLSTSPDWEAKSTWFYGVNEDYGAFESIPEVKKKVDEILTEAQTEMDSVSLLTHWVADEIRYSGLSMGEGEGFTLHNAEMNFTDRCGVCKDKASMLITMLRAAGFESYPAMTMAGSRIDYIPADQFNHCVTVVKMSDNKYHVLDPTWVPFTRELWSSLEQQQNYLMGLPEGADLSITEISPAENHYLNMDGVASLDENGTLSGEFKLVAEGQEDASIRRLFTSNYKAAWDEALKKELKATAPFVKVLEMDYGKPYDYLAGPLTITIKYEIEDYAIVGEKEMILKPYLVSGIFKRAMTHLYMNTYPEEKNYPFKDRCSRLINIHEQIILPEGFTFEEVADKHLSDIASTEYSITQKDRVLMIDLMFRSEKRVYEASEWADFRTAVLKHKDLIKKSIVLTR